MSEFSLVSDSTAIADLSNDVLADAPVIESAAVASSLAPAPVSTPANSADSSSAMPINAAFAALGLDPLVQAGLSKAGITVPSPVQAQAIPRLLAGKDLIASAPTGTGKTAAFLLPALHRLLTPSDRKAAGPRILVLTPTRELAQQVAQAAQTFSSAMRRCKTVCITGGESYHVQNRYLSAPYDILVATPGRLMDQMNNGRIDFSRLDVLVLDEADRMLDMGFADDVLHIAQALPRQRQTVCFTATLSPSVKQLTDQLLRSPEWLEVAQQTTRHASIDQKVVFVDGGEHKRTLLRHWLVAADLDQAIVFMSTKRDVEQLADELEDAGLPAVALHGDLMQRQRTRTLNRLRRGECKILVATDVAARGLDVSTVSHVFNFDLPRFAEDYVHRIGRTGRAGATGTAISFVGRQDVPLLKRIERFIGFKVQVTQVEGMEARFKPSDKPMGERRPSAEHNGRRPSTRSHTGNGGGGGYGGGRGRSFETAGAAGRGSWGARDGASSAPSAPRERSFSSDRSATPRSSFGRDAAPRSGGYASRDRDSQPRSFGSSARDGAPRSERGYGAASTPAHAPRGQARSGSPSGNAPSRPSFAGERGGVRRERGGRY